MKRVLLFLIIAVNYISAQQASDYFPSISSKWYFVNTPLDSLNNPIDSLTFFSTDSVAFQADYEGRSAIAVVSKLTHSDEVPYMDTSYVHFDGSDAWIYMDAFGAADSIPDADSIGVVSFLSTFRGWYPVFKFSQDVNLEYDIVKRDTTFLLDTLSVPIRIHVKGKRLQDENITTSAGTFMCKKFLISPSIGIVLSPVIPPIPLIDMLDTVWIAESRWIVKDIIPSAPLSFSLFGGPSFYLPGQKTEMITKPTGVEKDQDLVAGYSLKQNYPNPFNPETRIEYTLPEAGHIQIAVYNNMGEQIALLFKGVKNAGSHELTFNAERFSTGVYYYRLTTDKFSFTRKMILLK